MKSKPPAESEGVLSPQNLDAEADVVGAILFEGAKGVEASKRVVEAVRETGLTRSEFYWDVTHGLVYEAALSLVDRGEPSDRLAVVHELERTGQLEKVGGKVAVHELAAVVSTSANVCHHARLIREKARRRRERQFAMSLERASLNGGLEADPDLRDELRGLLADDIIRTGLRTRGVMLERVRPMRWLWARRIPMGLQELRGLRRLRLD